MLCVGNHTDHNLVHTSCLASTGAYTEMLWYQDYQSTQMRDLIPSTHSRKGEQTSRPTEYLHPCTVAHASLLSSRLHTQGCPACLTSRLLPSWHTVALVHRVEQVQSHTSNEFDMCLG